MKRATKVLAILLSLITLASVIAIPVAAEYNYPMALTIYYKDEAGNTVAPTLTGSFNAAATTKPTWTSPTVSGYALKNDSDAVVTYEMLNKSFPASNYVRNGSATYTVVYVKTYTHTVYFLNGETSASVSSSTQRTGKPGTSYSISVPSITGMTASKSTVRGTFQSSNTSETVYYYPITYTISYDANGGSGAPESQTKKYGVNINITTSKPTRTGYTFTGWSRSASSSTLAYSSGDTYSANASATLYAVWNVNKYTVSFDANGGSGAPASLTKIYGLDMTLPSTTPTRSGYTFKGWGLSSSTTSVAYQPGGTYSANAGRTLYAVWESNAPTTYTVSYNANGGSGAPSSQTKTQGVTLTLSSTRPTRNGYTFKGWSTSSSATSVNYNPGGSYVRNASITLYAVWECSHPTSAREYITGCDWKEVCTTCGAVTATGTTHGPYTYGSWAYYSTSQHRRLQSCNYGDYSAYEYGSHSTLTNYDEYSSTQHKKYSYCTTCSSTVGSVSYEAHSFTTTTFGGVVTRTCTKCAYTESDAQTYTVSYNANGGSGAPASQTKTHGVALTLSSVQPTRTGYTFKGWALTSDAVNASFSAGGSYTANANVTLFAVWSCSHTSYNTRYVTGCDWERYCTTCGVVLATGTTHGPYSYSGWVYSNTSSHSRVKECDYGDYSTIEFATHSAETKFESVSDSQHKYYLYCADCDHTVSSETLEPHDFTSRIESGRTHYECSLCGYEYSEALTYTVIFNANGGEGEPMPQVKTHDVALTLSSAVPTRVGYDFKGWGTTASATTAVYQPGDTYTANIGTTLYAVWEQSEYTVTYNANGGSGAPASQTKHYGGTITISSVIPTRTNHVFKGWATTPTATDIEYNPGDNYTANASVTLYAVWIERNFDFSVSGLQVTPNEVKQFDKVTVRLRTDNWDRNLPYEDIPVEVLLNGSVIFTKNLNFTAYGVQNVVFDLYVGAMLGEQTLDARINWADHLSETRTGNNSISTTFTVTKVAETSTSIVDITGDYIEGNEVITSFYVDNEGSSDILPSDNVSFDFRVYRMDDSIEVTVYEATWNNVVIPATGRNLVYFKWKVPDDSAGTTLFCKGTVNAVNADKEDNSDNNSYEKSVMVQHKLTSQTENTRYEDKAPASYNPAVSAPTVKIGKATWNMWEYEGGSFILKTYGIQVPNDTPTLKASDNCKTAVYNGGKLTMRSGYGISLYFKLYLSNPGGAVFAPADSFTFPQSVYATFPEYGYSTETDRYRTLDYTGAICSFLPNSDAEGNEKIHFIPLYVKNGEYIVSVTATQIWTPAGMITAIRNSNAIIIEGTIYDDYYHGN